jgi:hypothetical protein
MSYWVLAVDGDYGYQLEGPCDSIEESRERAVFMLQRSPTLSKVIICDEETSLVYKPTVTVDLGAPLSPTMAEIAHKMYEHTLELRTRNVVDTSPWDPHDRS